MTAFLDTNLLVYAQTTDPKGETARQVMAGGGTISVQVLNELADILRREFALAWDEVAQALEDVKTALGPIQPITLETHGAALELSRQHGFGIYDSLIIAAALEAGCSQLLTEDLQAGRRLLARPALCADVVLKHAVDPCRVAFPRNSEVLEHQSIDETRAGAGARPCGTDGIW